MRFIKFNILCNTEESANLEQLGIESEQTEYRQGYIVAESIISILPDPKGKAIIYTNGAEVFYTDISMKEALSILYKHGFTIEESQDSAPIIESPQPTTDSLSNQ